MAVAERQQEIVDDFAMFDEWEDKYAYLISLGKSLPPYPEEKKDAAHFIKGCQSLVWLDLGVEDGRLKMIGFSDAAIVSGLIALLRYVYHDAPLEEVSNEPLTCLKEIGLDQHLSPTRNNGLYAMLKTVREFALARAG